MELQQGRRRVRSEPCRPPGSCLCAFYTDGSWNRRGQNRVPDPNRVVSATCNVVDPDLNLDPEARLDPGRHKTWERRSKQTKLLADAGKRCYTYFELERNVLLKEFVSTKNLVLKGTKKENSNDSEIEYESFMTYLIFPLVRTSLEPHSLHLNKINK
jgi:hypothetical protein